MIKSREGELLQIQISPWTESILNISHHSFLYPDGILIRQNVPAILLIRGRFE